MSSSAWALEVRGTVAATQASGQVRIMLPAGAAVATGDEVRLEAELPGIGPVAIQTRWHVTETGPGFAVADPQSKPSASPQAGYIAVIETSAPQGQADVPEGPPAVAAGVPEQECDRLAANPADSEKVGNGVADGLIDTDKAIAACSEAIQSYPSERRFAYQLARARFAAKDYTAAIPVFADLAARGYVIAMVSLGYAYGYGLGVPKDHNEAVRWFRKAADLGNALAINDLASAYVFGMGVAQDQAEALRLFRKAVELGDPLAKCNLGRMYLMGASVPKDDHEAARLIRECADGGERLGYFLLGHLNASGAGVPQDLAAAVKLYIKAAQMQQSDAMLQLGDMCFSGTGVPKDLITSASWYRRAAEAGNVVAMNKLGLAYVNGHGVGKDQAAAVNWFRKGAEAGEPDAMFNLGAMMEDGRGTRKDDITAARWIFKSIKSGSSFARTQMVENVGTYSRAFRRELQRLLKQEGVYAGPIDGDFGPETKQAIQALGR